MTDTSESAHPYKKRLGRPPSTPASSCFRCHRSGIVSPEQTNVANAKGGTPIGGGTHHKAQTRFDCTCGNTWLTSTHDALAHGRFLDRAGLR